MKHLRIYEKFYNLYDMEPGGYVLVTPTAFENDIATIIEIKTAYIGSLSAWKLACHVKFEHRKDDEITPWIEAFVNAREWIRKLI